MERVPCEFFLIRYVPDVVKGEFVNIGVVLREASGERRSAVRFTRDWRRVRCVHADADIELMEGLEQEVIRRLEAGVSVRDPKDVIEGFSDTFSASLQITDAKATLAENLVTEMELLSRMYVEPLKVVRPQTKVRTGRAMIAEAMRREFEGAGVWGPMWKQIRAAKFTSKNDPLRIVCGYRAFRQPGRATPNDIIRMFQAVSLAADVDSAKGLAFSAPHLRAGVKEVEDGRLELTAVVEPLKSIGNPEDEEDENVARYRFGVETLERSEIRVVTIKDLVGAAKTAQRELEMAPEF